MLSGLTTVIFVASLAVPVDGSSLTMLIPPAAVIVAWLLITVPFAAPGLPAVVVDDRLGRGEVDGGLDRTGEARQQPEEAGEEPRPKGGAAEPRHAGPRGAGHRRPPSASRQSASTTSGSCLRPAWARI